MSCFDLFWGFWASLQVLVGDYIPNSWRMFRFTNPWMVEVINGCAKSCHNYTFHWLLFFRLFHRRIEMFNVAWKQLLWKQSVPWLLSRPQSQFFHRQLIRVSDPTIPMKEPTIAILRCSSGNIRHVLTAFWPPEVDKFIQFRELSRTAIWMATAKFV